MSSASSRWSYAAWASASVPAKTHRRIGRGPGRALSHALTPDDDPDLFLAELRHAAGLSVDRDVRRKRTRHRSVSNQTIGRHT